MEWVYARHSFQESYSNIARSFNIKWIPPQRWQPTEPSPRLVAVWYNVYLVVVVSIKANHHRWFGTAFWLNVRSSLSRVAREVAAKSTLVPITNGSIFLDAARICQGPLQRVCGNCWLYDQLRNGLGLLDPLVKEFWWFALLLFCIGWLDLEIDYCIFGKRPLLIKITLWLWC